MITFLPLTGPAAALTARAECFEQVRAGAPSLDLWVARFLARLLGDPLATIDSLLLLADALEDASREAMAYGDPIAFQLKRCADLPRARAADLARPRSRCEED